MDHATRLGPDVHKEMIAVATLRPGQALPEERVIANTPEALRDFVRRHRSHSQLIACSVSAATSSRSSRGGPAAG